MLNEVLIPCQGSLLSLSQPVHHCPLLALSFPLAMEAVVFEHSLHPLRVQGCKCEGGVLVQPTNGTELWRINWQEWGPGGGEHVMEVEELVMKADEMMKDVAVTGSDWPERESV